MCSLMCACMCARALSYCASNVSADMDWNSRNIKKQETTQNKQCENKFMCAHFHTTGVSHHNRQFMPMEYT